MPWDVNIRVGVKYNWSSTQILQVLVIKYKYLACSPELGTTEGYPFKIDFNLLS